MSDRDFGVLIRQSRERLGLTPSRVAELIGRAPGTVRAWEKGTSTPADAGVVSTLAAVLGIDEASLFQAAGLEPPVSESAPRTVQEALSTITPSARRAEAESVEDQVPEPSESSSEDAFGPDRETLPERRADRRKSRAVPPPPTPDAFGSLVPAPPVTVPLASSVRGEAVEAVAHEPRHRAPAATSGVLDRLRGATVRRPTPAAAPSTLPPAPRAPSYIEDPGERLSYRLRALYTVLGVVALFVALGWAASNLFEALGSVWEILTSNL